MMDETKKIIDHFDIPRQNWSKLPHQFINALHKIDSLAELKCVLYILRHTWGFSEYETKKKITIDEFMSGRKQKDGSRIDNGTGLSKNSVIKGLDLAIEHGFVTVETDESDLARIKKYYSLNVLDVQNLNIGVQDLNIGDPNFEHRSEKETIERNSGKEKNKRAKPASPRKDPNEILTDVKWNTSKDDIQALGDTFTQLIRNPMRSEFVFWRNGLIALKALGATPEALAGAIALAKKEWPDKIASPMSFKTSIMKFVGRQPEQQIDPERAKRAEEQARRLAGQS